MTRDSAFRDQDEVRDWIRKAVSDWGLLEAVSGGRVDGWRYLGEQNVSHFALHSFLQARDYMRKWLP